MDLEVGVHEGPSQAEEPYLMPYCNLTAVSPHSHDELAAQAVWWCNVVGVPLIAAAGLAANLLNIAILTSNRASRRIPSWQLLLALAISDCFFLIFATIDVTPSSMTSLAQSPLFNLIYAHSALYIRTVASTFYKTSVLIVVAFNVERYICVVHPLCSHRICTGRASRAAIFTSFCISLLCSIQWPICYEVIPCEVEGMASFYIIMQTLRPALKLYYRIMDYTSLFAFNVLPICAVLGLNARLIVTLSKVADEDAKRTGPQTEFNGGFVQEERRPGNRVNANAMLFAVVLCLLICVGPQAPARLLFDFYGHYHSTAIVYTCITQLLVFLNASLNFVLYCVVSRRYRALMKATIKRMAQGVIERSSYGTSAIRSKSSSAHATLLEETPSRPLIPMH
ncbi:unnamed protein product, partial [Mesorhabditis spiculigera]